MYTTRYSVGNDPIRQWPFSLEIEMTADRSPRALRTAAKRDAILDAAIREFRTAGFESTSMDRIAEVAGVSKRTVYNHFPSKEVLFGAIVHRLRVRCEPSEVHGYDPGGDLREQLTAIARGVVSINESKDFQNLARVILARFLDTPDLARQMIGENDGFNLGLAEWIRAASEAGQLSVDDPEHAAKQFKGLLSTFTFWPQLMGRLPATGGAEREKIVESTVAMFLDHYGTAP